MIAPTVSAEVSPPVADDAAPGDVYPLLSAMRAGLVDPETAAERAAALLGVEPSSPDLRRLLDLPAEEDEP